MRPIPVLVASLAAVLPLCGLGSIASADPPVPLGVGAYGHGRETLRSPAAEQERLEGVARLNRLGADARKAVRENHIDEAIRLYKEADTVFPASVQVPSILALADIYTSLGRYAEAVQQYERLWVRDSGVPRFNSGNQVEDLKYAILLQRVGRTRDALAVYQRIMDCDEMREGLEGVSVTRNVRVDPENFYVEDFEFALNLATGVGMKKFGGGENYEALPYLKEASRIRPHSAVPYFYMGCLLRGTNTATLKQYGTPEAMFRLAAKHGTGDVKQKMSEGMVRLGYRPSLMEP